MLCVLVNIGFQVLFHSPPGVLFTFPSQYCSTIGHQVVFRLGGWAPRIPIGFHVSDGTLDTAKSSWPFTYETLTPFGWPSHVIRLDLKVLYRGPNPTDISIVVWPLPLSLATTRGISFDFSSSPYLDVSVREVPYVKLCIYLTLRNAWVSPFGNPRIEAYLQLPEAYRSLSRPSSAPDAKAFALCSFSLELPII